MPNLSKKQGSSSIRLTTIPIVEIAVVVGAPLTSSQTELVPQKLRVKMDNRLKLMQSSPIPNACYFAGQVFESAKLSLECIECDIRVSVLLFCYYHQNANS
ncbi:uncharacterized protein LOC119766465 [Culex quinquefasciatus]|uniref:uncharacterized protein LOC119766465 n=1 Tax=Culex quinquefasciatus TaxID=7176 RepID=UPI0018E3EF23|nr:uncharacterized protein LOC119766465 [Culex quinquefasciatus]